MSLREGVSGCKYCLHNLKWFCNSSFSPCIAFPEKPRSISSRVFFVGHILGVCRKEGINENLKATDQIDWVAHMNIISDRTIEIVNADLIFV